MIPRSEITGVILAGGRSSRMGADKALMRLDGVSLIEHIAHVMQQVFEEVVIITNLPFKYRDLHLPSYPDIYRDCGPLGGIHSAFVHTKASQLFVVPCDTPFVSKELIEYIITFQSSAPAKVASTQETVHPLCGLYARSCFPVLMEHLRERKLRVLDLLNDVNAMAVPITPDLSFYNHNLLRNINEPKDIAPHKAPISFNPLVALLSRRWRAQK